MADMFKTATLLTI